MNTTEEWDRGGGVEPGGSLKRNEEQEHGQARLGIFSHHSHSGALLTSVLKALLVLRGASGQAVEVAQNAKEGLCP